MHKMIQAEELFKHLARFLREMYDKLAERNPNTLLSCDFNAEIRREVKRFGQRKACESWSPRSPVRTRTGALEVGLAATCFGHP